MRRVAVFARRPEVGKVKTRLSPALPPELACVLYRGMLEDAVAAVRESRLADERYVWWAEGPERPSAGEPARPAGGSRDATPNGFVARHQVTGDLGVRLNAAFAELLHGPEDRAVVVGADCPSLRQPLVDAALARLESVPLVIAPASDGGYVLIGLTRPMPEIFRGVSWSSPLVLGQTLERARAAGIPTAVLETLPDVDSPGDLCDLVARIATGSPAPATARALRDCGLLPDDG